MSMDPIMICGSQHAASLPSMGAREVLLEAWRRQAEEPDARVLLVAGAVIGACTGLGGTTLARCGYDALAYGDRCYSWLREHGASPADVTNAAMGALRAMAEATFPREREVTEAAGFSGGGEGGPTSSL